MKYFIDTEFIEYPHTIDLISIAIVSESGDEYYAVSSEFDESKASDWVKDNVLPTLDSGVCKSKLIIKNDILEFIGNGKPEFWGYFADYDWVVFCWLFGTMMDLPKGWPMYCKDLKQVYDEKGIMAIPQFLIYDERHNALEDARWNRDLYKYLKHNELLEA